MITYSIAALRELHAHAVEGIRDETIGFYPTLERITAVQAAIIDRLDSDQRGWYPLSSESRPPIRDDACAAAMDEISAAIKRASRSPQGSWATVSVWALQEVQSAFRGRP